MKRCSKCLTERPESEFYHRKSIKRFGELYEKCKACMRARGRLYYQNNRTSQLPLAIKRRHKAYAIKRAYIEDVKDRPCVDCRQKFPSCAMDFDHRGSENKLGNVSRITVQNWSLERIKKEIEKCDIVCANCHRVRTRNRQAELAKVVKAGL